VCFLYACKGAHTLFTGQREREREKERKRVIKRGRERERGIKREREREKKREYVFLKRMTGALAPFNYLVDIKGMSPE
jgi:hypothetical protein